jgi:hypothetical protein
MSAEMPDTRLLQARLFAIELRLGELDDELRRTLHRVHRLEAELEDARLASLLGVPAGARAAAEIGNDLATSRDDLERQQALVETVRKSRWKARVEYTMRRARERREERAARDAATPAAEEGE